MCILIYRVDTHWASGDQGELARPGLTALVQYNYSGKSRVIEASFVVWPGRGTTTAATLQHIMETASKRQCAAHWLTSSKERESERGQW